MSTSKNEKRVKSVESTNKIHSTPEDPIEPIKAVGKERTVGKEYEEAIKENKVIKAWDSINAMRDEANTDKIMPEETVKEILDEANKNPVTKNLIEEARKITIENSESIQKQINDLVALYNVEQNKAFFFITSAEARLAIDYVKRCREGHIQDLQSLDDQDKKIHKLMKQLPELKLNTKASEIEDTNLRGLYEDLRGLCWAPGEEEVYRGREMQMPLSTDAGLFFSTLYGDQDLDKRIEILEDSQKELEADGVKIKETEPREFPEFIVHDYKMRVGKSGIKYDDLDMTLSSINQLFSSLEQFDLTVDVLIMNAHNTGTIRSWGQTVYDAYSKREFIRRKVFGKLFTSEIYICNYLKDNQILAGALGVKPHGIFLNALFSDK